MNVRILKKHGLFSVLFFITMLVLLLDQMGDIQYTEVLRKIKYCYIIAIAVIIIGSGRLKCGSKIALTVLVGLLLHTILFGLVFRNNIVAEATQTHFIQMLIFLSMVSVTYLYINQYKIFPLFVDLSFTATGIQLLIAGMLHVRDFVNPVWGVIQTFTKGDLRYKTTFGFVHAGYLSNACYLVVALSVLHYALNKEKSGSAKIVAFAKICLFDGLAVLMAVSAAERSGLISIALVIVIYVVLEIFPNSLFRNKATRFFLIILAGVILIVFFCSGAWSYVWANSSRSLNVTVNFPVFRQLGSWWTGMGYVESSGFQKDVSVYGITTSSLDMYYVYIFLTTGIIGSIIIGGILILILMRLLRRQYCSCKNAILGIYLSMLFFAFWQVNLFTYRYMAPFFLTIVLLASLNVDCCAGKYNNRM